jgi:hypothetical protein
MTSRSDAAIRPAQGPAKGRGAGCVAIADCRSRGFPGAGVGGESVFGATMIPG